MPSSMTHTYFGLNIYNKLPVNCKNKIKDSLEYYKLFCQGSDPFMFYNLRVGNKAKDMIELQKIMHTYKTKDFFISIIEYINDNKLLDDSNVMSYLYGYIAHYYLDSYVHPYIYYKGGKFNSKDKSTSKYNGRHQEIEYMIDMYYIDKYEDISHKKFKTYKYIFNVDNFSTSLINIINYSIEKNYNIKDIADNYLKSSKYQKLFFRIFNYDPYGIKLFFYKIIDKITPWYIINTCELSFHNDIDYSYINLEHNKWNLPWDKSINSRESLIDIMDRALKDSVNTIISVTKMLENKKIDYKELNNIFGDLSFVTGKNYKLELEMKYYEF